MTFLAKIKTPQFWLNFVKVALPFFIIVILVSLLMNSWRQIFAGDWAGVTKINFDNGLWVRFWATKVVVSFVYGIYVVNKNMK